MKENIVLEAFHNTLETDFKVEALAANLLKYYNSQSSIFIKRVGLNDRPYAKDVKNVYSSYYGLDEETVVMETYRESIYDYLPEGLFHPPSLGNYNKNVDNIIREIRKQKEVEENARNFFQPFELEIFYTEIAALLKETEFDIVDKSDVLLDTLSELWPLLKQVSPDVAKTFFYILPFLHEVRGNKAWIERFLKAFLKTEVKISFVPNTVDADDDTEGITTLGKTKLGITFIPIAKHMDGERNWQVNIGPIPYKNIEQYVPGHPFRNLLQQIYDYLMPVSVKIYEEFVTEKAKDSFLMGNNGKTSRLGFSTFI